MVDIPYLFTEKLWYINLNDEANNWEIMRLDTGYELQIHRYRNGIKLQKTVRENRYYSYIGHTVESLLQLPLCIHFSDSDNNIRKINENTAIACGFISANDAVGKSMLSVSEKQSALQINNNCNEIMTNKNAKIFDEYVIRKDEIINRCLSVKLPWYNDENKVIGVFGCTIISDKKPMADSLVHIAQLGFLEASFLAPHTNPRPLSIDNYKLSKRQIECLSYMMNGYSIKEIAREINLSVRTIEH